MPMIQTTHRDYMIHYSENEDVWRCSDLGLDRATLTLLKNAINRKLAAANKSRGTIDAMEIVRDYDGEMEPVKITGRAPPGYKSEPRVWVMKQHWAKGEKLVRRMVSISSLFINTPENAAKASGVEALNKQIAALNKERYEAMKAISRLTVDDLAELEKDDDE